MSTLLPNNNNNLLNSFITLSINSIQNNISLIKNQIILKTKIGEKKIKILVDSGAQGNCISPECIKELNLKIMPLEKNINIKLADGNDYFIAKDKTSINLKLGNNHKEIQIEGVIVPIKEDIILGMPWLSKYDAWIGCKSAILHYKYNDKIYTAYGTRKTNERKNNFPSLLSMNEIDILIDKNDVKEMALISVTEGNIVNDQNSQIKISNIALLLDTEIKRWITNYNDVFSKSPDGLPPNRDIEHRIDLLPEATPQNQPPYRHSFLEEQELKKQLTELIETKKINPSISPWGAPVLFVKKKDGTLRMCVDYCRLNKLTIKDSFTIPRIDDFLDTLNGAKVFSKLDLHQAYYQVQVKKEDRHKTAFRTKFGTFEFNVLPFGLTNAPATFQRLIQNILQKYLNKFVIAYLDGILIFSKTVEEHKDHVKKVLDELRKEKLHCKIEKCELFKDSVEFLGHIIKHNRIEMDPLKLKAIEDWEIPKSIKDVQRFHGTCNFYHRFIKDFSKIAAPLTEVLKGEDFNWMNEAQESFNNLKKILISQPIIQPFDPYKPKRLECDASDYAIGAVLHQKDETGWHPVAYYSKKLSKFERNQAIYEKELLAIIRAFEIWHHYLHGSHFTVLTDQRALSWLLNQQKIQGKLARYLNILSNFDFEIEYRKGSLNIIADALSRPPIQKEEKQTKRIKHKFNYELPKSSVELINSINKIPDNEEIKQEYKINENGSQITYNDHSINKKNDEGIINNNNNKILSSPEVIHPSIQNQYFDQEISDLTNKIADLNINKELEPMIIETLGLIGENTQSDQEKLKIKILNPNAVLPKKNMIQMQVSI